jgi:dethiobiotin synthetase
MKKRIFITATNTNIGKTYTTKKLLEAFSRRGLAVGVIKPIETGVIDGYAQDGEELLECVKSLNPKLWSLEVEDIVPITYELPAAPFIASNNTPFDFKKVLKALEAMEANCDIVLIEGAGGLYVPIDEKLMMIDLIKMLDASALLVTHCSLGCINDTILSQKALESLHVSHLTAFNCKDDQEKFAIQSESYFLHANQRVLKVDEDIDLICELLYNL